SSYLWKLVGVVLNPTKHKLLIVILDHFRPVFEIAVVCKCFDFVPVRRVANALTNSRKYPVGKTAILEIGESCYAADVEQCGWTPLQFGSIESRLFSFAMFTSADDEQKISREPPILRFYTAGCSAAAL
ncbi:MAG: hypothetical protein ACK53L_29560, partial [Pirellulaceae bacterium]